MVELAYDNTSVELILLAFGRITGAMIFIYFYIPSLALAPYSVVTADILGIQCV